MGNSGSTSPATGSSQNSRSTVETVAQRGQRIHVLREIHGSKYVGFWPGRGEETERGLEEFRRAAEETILRCC